jgi:hypothetical protein
MKPGLPAHAMASMEQMPRGNRRLFDIITFGFSYLAEVSVKGTELTDMGSTVRCKTYVTAIGLDGPTTAPHSKRIDGYPEAHVARAPAHCLEAR